MSFLVFARYKQKQQAVRRFRVLRSVSLIVIFTFSSTYLMLDDPFPPHRNPLLYALAVPWLVAITVAFVVAVPTSAIFSFRANLTDFP